MSKTQKLYLIRGSGTKEYDVDKEKQNNDLETQKLKENTSTPQWTFLSV